MNILSKIQNYSVELQKTGNISIAAKMKREYSIYRKEQTKKDGAKMSVIEGITNVLLSNYDQIKNFKDINELLEILISDMDSIGEQNKSEQQTIDDKIFKIATKITGNPGSDINSGNISEEHMSRMVMPADLERYKENVRAAYIDKLIRFKLNAKDGINRDDIINLLKQAYRDIYSDVDGYQELIGSSIEQIVDMEITNGTINIQNAEVLSILEDYAKTYIMKTQDVKYKKDYDKNLEKALSIYEKALKLDQFENTEQYKETELNYKEFREYSKFRRIQLNSLADLSKVIQDLLNSISIGVPIFKKGQNQPNPNPFPTPGPNRPGQMDPLQRVEAIKVMIEKLRQEYPNIDITQVVLGTENYAGYVILPIDDTNISVFESFKPGNAAIYFVEDKDVSNVIGLTKRTARRKPNVESANHKSDPREFNDYVDTIVTKARSMISRTSNPSKEGTLIHRSRSRLDAYNEKMQRYAQARADYAKAKAQNRTGQRAQP